MQQIHPKYLLNFNLALMPYVQVIEPDIEAQPANGVILKGFSSQ